jgi:hypothetical protein
MCGKINHLLDTIRDDLKITMLDGFGFPVPPELLAEKKSAIEACILGAGVP